MGFTFAGLLIESIVFTLAYHLLGFRLFKSWMTKYCEKQDWWSTVGWDEDKTEEENKEEVLKVQEELKYLSILSIHHLFGGMVMTLGYLTNSPTIFAHAVLVEVADDVHDSLVLLLRWWPFNGKDTSKLIMYMLPHHMFGLLISFPMILNGWHKNVNAMAIGSALLMAGGITLAVHTIQRSQNRKNAQDAWEQYWIGLLNSSVFYFCRFYVFPVRSYRMLFTEGMWSQMTPATKAVAAFGMLCMTYFNVLVGLDIIVKLDKSLKNAREMGGYDEAVEITTGKLKKYAADTTKNAEQMLEDAKALTVEDIAVAAERTGKASVKALSEIEFDFGDLEKDFNLAVEALNGKIQDLGKIDFKEIQNSEPFLKVQTAVSDTLEKISSELKLS